MGGVIFLPLKVNGNGGASLDALGIKEVVGKFPQGNAEGG